VGLTTRQADCSSCARSVDCALAARNQGGPGALRPSSRPAFGLRRSRV